VAAIHLTKEKKKKEEEEDTNKNPHGKEAGNINRGSGLEKPEQLNATNTENVRNRGRRTA
jgi:hypothetical protein